MKTEMALHDLYEKIQEIFHKWDLIAEDMKKRGASLNYNGIMPMQQEVRTAISAAILDAENDHNHTPRYPH